MAAGSFKIYSLQKDGARIPAAGSINSGGDSGIQFDIIETQVTYTAMMTDTLL